MPNIILVVMVSFVLSLIFTRVMIYTFLHLKVGKNIRNDGPPVHLLKAGTPSFGGVAVLLSIFLVILLFAPNNLIFQIFAIIFGFSFIGFIDDYYNFKKTRALGLKSRYKILLQLMLSVLSAFFFYNYFSDTTLFIPILEVKINLQYFYLLLMVLIFLASCNAVNLTDGLDGLSSGTSIIVLGGFLYFSVKLSNLEASFLCAATIGSLLGFLWFNAHPAKIFMGDTGSLMLGAIFATVAIMLKKELCLLVMGGIFVLEALSVIIQVVSFRLRKKRVFKMAPLHHHFELSGWKETEVVVRFWILSVVFVLGGIWLFK